MAKLKIFDSNGIAWKLTSTNGQTPYKIKACRDRSISGGYFLDSDTEHEAWYEAVKMLNEFGYM